MFVCWLYLGMLRTLVLVWACSVPLCRSELAQSACVGMSMLRWLCSQGVGPVPPYIHSNSSMRCLVFPERIWRSVLYLSRPARTFSAWITSFTVFLVSSRAVASSELSACRGTGSTWTNEALAHNGIKIKQLTYRSARINECVKSKLLIQKVFFSSDLSSQGL